MLTKRVIDGRTLHILHIDDVVSVARKGSKVEISQTVKDKIKRCRDRVDKFVAEQRPIYRITAKTYPL